MSKEEFISALKDEGYNAGYANNGIPTVFVDAAEEIKYVQKSLKKFVGKTDYTQSYGISLLKEKSVSTSGAV